MKKFFTHILILTLILGIFVPVLSFAQSGGGVGHGNPNLTPTDVKELTAGNTFWDYFANKLSDIFASILYLFLAIISYVLYIAGTLLDYVLRYTIIDLKVNLAQLTGINITWKLVKDLMNIAFIFILVYKGIELIIGVGTRESIKKFISTLILAALLVNFSLFFTRVLIDASNIATIGFYKAILQSSVQAIPINGPTGTQITQLTGISVPFMQNLGLASFWAKGTFTSVRTTAGGNWNMIILPLMGMFLFLITAFVFVAISIIFIIRYITLIILLILSPIAYMGAALPGFGKASKDWWDTLTGQLIFGPIYMIMTWIVLKLMSTSNFIISTSAFGELVSGGTGQMANVPYQQTSISLIFNFAVLIGLIIASLLVSKDAASRGSKFVGKAVGNASGMASTAVFGGTAWVGRKTMGNAGRVLSENAALQEAANKGTGLSGAASRLALWGTKKARDATYDTRNATIPTSLINDVARGTVGRYGWGKTLGLDDLQVGDIPVMSGVSDAMGAGQGGKKSVMDERKESADRVKKRKDAEIDEMTIAVAKRDLLKGMNAVEGTPEYVAFEKALMEISDKQTISILDSNKELLTSQNFANKISVKTLEAIEKSDLAEADKSALKNKRFEEIKILYNAADIAAYNAANAVPAAARTTAQKAAVKKMEDAKTKTKGLAKSEIEMLDYSEYLTKKEVIAELRSAQFETIANSDGFTASQKKDIKNLRISPLLDALDTSRATYAPNNAHVKKMLSKGGLSPEDLAGLYGTEATYLDHSGTTVTRSILLHPEVIAEYNPSKLKKMNAKLTSENADAIRAEIVHAAGLPGASQKVIDLRDWLATPDGTNNFG